MPDTTSGPTPAGLDDELRHLALALVAEAPEAPGFAALADLRLRREPPEGPVERPAGGSHRSLRRRDRRYAAAVGGIAAAVTLIVVGAVVLSTDGSDDGDGPASVLAADAGLEPAPQRLVLDGTVELTADGQLVDLEVDGLDGLDTAEPTIAFRTDGSYVVVGVWPSDPLPEAFNDLPFGLAVVGADGSVEAEHQIEGARLLGVAGDEAILFHRPLDAAGRNVTGPAELIAHDLATGDERPIAADTVDPDRLNAYTGAAVVGDELVAIGPDEAAHPDYPHPAMPTGPAPENGSCVLRRLGLTTGEETETPLGFGCEGRAMRISPDGTLAAVTYTTLFGLDDVPDSTPEDHVAVIDLHDGDVVYDERVAEALGCTTHPAGCPDDAVPYLIVQGMAWTDGSTLRVAAGADPHDLAKLAIGDLAIP
jgi:hypothetical protein